MTIKLRENQTRGMKSKNDQAEKSGIPKGIEFRKLGF